MKRMYGTYRPVESRLENKMRLGKIQHSVCKRSKSSLIVSTLNLGQESGPRKVGHKWFRSSGGWFVYRRRTSPGGAYRYLSKGVLVFAWPSRHYSLDQRHGHSMMAKPLYEPLPSKAGWSTTSPCSRGLGRRSRVQSWSRTVFSALRPALGALVEDQVLASKPRLADAA